MILEITAEHITKSRRIEACRGHHAFLNPIAVALHDIDPYTYVTLDKVHRSCVHGTLCRYYACEAVTLTYTARAYLEAFNRSGFASPTVLVL